MIGRGFMGMVVPWACALAIPAPARAQSDQAAELAKNRSNPVASPVDPFSQSKQWQEPLIVQVGQLLKLGPQIVQLAAAAKYWADSPENGPDGWGLRVQLTFLFPK